MSALQNTLVEETKIRKLTDEIKTFLPNVFQELKRLSLEHKELKVYADWTNATVKVVWSVNDSDFFEDLSLCVQAVDIEGMIPFDASTNEVEIDKAFIIARSFEKLGYKVYTYRNNNNATIVYVVIAEENGIWATLSCLGTFPD